MRITPHLVIASLAVLLALLMTLPRLGGTGLKSGPFTDDPKVLLDNYLRPVKPGSEAINSLVPEPLDVIEINNPFLPPLAANQVTNGGSRLPPPPPFDLPEPLPLPLSEK